MRIANKDVDPGQLAEICQRYGVCELSIFGSVLRGTERPDSDIDLLFVLAPNTRLGWGVEHLNRELNDVFGRKVDLVSKNYIHRLIRDEVLAESKVLYAQAA